MSITSKDWEMRCCGCVLPEWGCAGGRAAWGQWQSYCRDGGMILSQVTFVPAFWGRVSGGFPCSFLGGGGQFGVALSQLHLGDRRDEPPAPADLAAISPPYIYRYLYFIFFIYIYIYFFFISNPAPI